MRYNFLLLLILVSTQTYCQIEDPILLEEGRFQKVLAQEDFNKDGIPDLVLLESYECETIYDVVYYHGEKNDQSAEVTYNEVVREEVGIPYYFASPPIDIDGDNDLDLVLSFGFGLEWQLLLINEIETFEFEAYEEEVFPSFYYNQDFNGDLIADGFEMDTYRDSLYINLSKGDYEWERIPIDYCNYCTDYAMEDLDGDNDLDYINYKDDTLYISLIESMEIVEKKKMYFHDVEIYYKNNLVADIDQNGELDLLLIKESDDYKIDSLFILFNPAGNSQLEYVSLIDYIHSLGAILDLDMDGIPSILLNVYGGAFIEVSYSSNAMFEIDTIEIIGSSGMYLQQEKKDYGKLISEIDIPTSDNFHTGIDGFISRLIELEDDSYLLDRFNLYPKEFGIKYSRLADIDNNGKDDLIIVSATSILAMTSSEEEHFSDLIEIIDFYDNINHLEVGDVNNDGWQDLVFSAHDRLMVMKGIGQGSFSNPEKILIENYIHDFDLYDINCDDYLDIVYKDDLSIHTNKVLKVLVQNDDHFDEYSLELERYIRTIDFVECIEGSGAELILVDDSDKLYAVKFEEQLGLSSTILNTDVPNWLGKQIFISENKQPHFIKVSQSDLNENEYILELRKYNRETEQMEYVVEPITYIFDNPQFSPGVINVFDVDGDKDVDIILGNKDSASNESHLVLENLENTTFSEPYLLSSIFNTDEFSTPFNAISYSALNCYENGLEISYLYTDCENLYILNGFSTKDIASSIDDLNIESIIYPNPSSGIIHFDNDVDFDSYMVVNSTGRIVKMGKMPSNNKLNLSKFDNGMYYLRFEKEGESFSRKIIIQK